MRVNSYLQTQKNEKNIKKAIWLYIIVLIFEGAARKWLLPSLATPLLLARDPIAFWLILKAFQDTYKKSNPYIYWLFIIGFFSFGITLLVGHGSIRVALYGLRIFILHLPVIFIIGKYFEKRDVLKVGYLLIITLIPMVILSMFQFYSPQSSFINRGVGGDIEGAGFGGALGFFRPSGTFSFINGLSSFYGLCSAFVFYYFLNYRLLPKWLLFGAIIALVLSIPFSISRTVLFQNLISFGFAFVVILRYPQKIKKFIPFCLVLLSLVVLFKTNSFFQTGFDAFSSRFISADESEGGLKGTLVDRVFGSMIEAVETAFDQNLWGVGLGADSNVGVKLLGISTDYRISDFERQRHIYEMGAFLGISFIFFRIYLTYQLLRNSLFTLFLKGDYLPWMLLSFSLMQILQGQISQPTSLGFVVISTGLVMVSNNGREKHI